MTTTITGATGIDNIQAATGAVLQVVSVTKVDTWTYTGSTNFQDVTGLSIAITPSSTSSKILVELNININSSERYSAVKLFRDSTQIGGGTASGSRQSVTISANGSNQNETYSEYVMRNSSASYLDSPNTTSATTYKVQAGNTSSSSMLTVINRTQADGDANWHHRGISTITLTEIAG